MVKKAVETDYVPIYPQTGEIPLDDNGNPDPDHTGFYQSEHTAASNEGRAGGPDSGLMSADLKVDAAQKEEMAKALATHHQRIGEHSSAMYEERIRTLALQLSTAYAAEIIRLRSGPMEAAQIVERAGAYLAFLRGE